MFTWLQVLALTLPCYLPLVFAAFAVGRKRISIAGIMIFTAIEAVAICWALCIE